jgi:GAF domain-containing protein
VPVDGQLVARTVAELRAVPEAEDLLARLGRVVEATRTVVGVDGTGLTLVHEDGPPRWVAVSDAAMRLLEEVRHDFGEGPCLAAFTEDRVVAVQDLRGELVWDRIAVVVRQLQVQGVLSVPVRLADQPVGTLDVYATQPRTWTPAEAQALGGVRNRDRRAGPYRRRARHPPARGGSTAAGAAQPGVDRAGQGDGGRHPRDRP